MADVREVVTAGIEAFNAHDREGMGARQASDIVFEAPGDVRLEGSDAVTEYAMMWLRAFPDGKLTIQNQVIAGEWASMEFTFEGTHEETLVSPEGEIPATGRRVSARGAEFFRVVDGKIVEDHLYFDQAQVMAQLGLMPEPA